MILYVTVDTKAWAKGRFPHASSACLRESACTIVESTTHSLAVNVVLQDMSTIGTLYVSNSNRMYFVESLKDINQNKIGYVDYKHIRCRWCMVGEYRVRIGKSRRQMRHFHRVSPWNFNNATL